MNVYDSNSANKETKHVKKQLLTQFNYYLKYIFYTKILTFWYKCIKTVKIRCQTKINMLFNDKSTYKGNKEILAKVQNVVNNFGLKW